MVGPGHCPLISKYGQLLFKAVGLVDLTFLVVKISHFYKKYSYYRVSTNSTKQKVHVGCQYSKIQKYMYYAATQKRPKMTLITNGCLMKVERIVECSPWSNLQYF